ncbi:MAG: hypothetical protein JNL75_01030 [Chitinophagales bacterium]|nr:hypothetical protein [Chitinophagales bacterium]
MEGQDSYEEWTRHSDKSLKGISYTLKNGVFKLNEYLDIKAIDNEVYYIPAVIGQNFNKEIRFKLQKVDNSFNFENPLHDFPKVIVYKFYSQDTLGIVVSDGAHKKFSYRLIKQKTMAKDSSIKNKNYDAELAEKLGADELGMRSYFLVILKTGSNTTTDKDIVQNSFRGHMDNIQRLVKEGKLIIAGPFLAKNANNYRGIFILNTKTIEETESLLQSDPAIKNKIFDVEIYPWYGSAALPEYLPAADKLWKEKP